MGSGAGSMIDINSPRYQLSSHFHAREFLHNWRGGEIEARNIELGLLEPAWSSLHMLCNEILEPIRARFGAPVTIASGFRYAEMVDGRWEGLDVEIRGGNARRNYLPKSQHTRGEAADIHVLGVPERDVFDWLWHHAPNPLGQCIYEVSGRSCWIHVSIPGYRIPERGGGMILGEFTDYRNGVYTSYGKKSWD